MIRTIVDALGVSGPTFLTHVRRDELASDPALRELVLRLKEVRRARDRAILDFLGIITVSTAAAAVLLAITGLLMCAGVLLIAGPLALGALALGAIARSFDDEIIHHNERMIISSALAIGRCPSCAYNLPHCTPGGVATCSECGGKWNVGTLKPDVIRSLTPDSPAALSRRPAVMDTSRAVLPVAIDRIESELNHATVRRMVKRRTRPRRMITTIILLGGIAIGAFALWISLRIGGGFLSAVLLGTILIGVPLWRLRPRSVLGRPEFSAVLGKVLFEHNRCPACISPLPAGDGMRVCEHCGASWHREWRTDLWNWQEIDSSKPPTVEYDVSREVTR